MATVCGDFYSHVAEAETGSERVSDWLRGTQLITIKDLSGLHV